MTNGADSSKKKRIRLRIVLAAIAGVVLVFVVPPLISVGRFKTQITHLISQSLGRPVRVSSIQAQLLPWPGFVLYDLSVAEDPAYGAEPVLHASKVTASLRLLALWRGRIEIGEISVDDASLNLVRAAPGLWNLDPIFRTAAANAAPGASSGRRAVPLPYLEATNSRINFKNGAEKLPFSLVNADLSFWQENPGEWRIRLRGQPARTDVSLHREETGVVRMEASIHTAPALREMPVHLDLDWRQAQLGQLARLIVGSDPGWRGDLTGELHLSGTADAAQIAMRLRAAGVQRAEFVPAAPLDFDANCTFLYHYTRRSLENLLCDSPLGNGRVRLTGEKLRLDTPPNFSVEFDRIPVAAGLDALRTLRSSLDPTLEASGAVSGKLVYAATAPPVSGVAPVSRPAVRAASTPPASKVHSSPPNPLTGSLTVTNFALSGGGLSRPVQALKITLEPATSPSGALPALAGTVAIPTGGETPLTFSVRLALSGYQVGMRGQASFARARELAHAAGFPQASSLASFAGDPIAVDLTAEGPWLPPEMIPGQIPQQIPPAAVAPSFPRPSAEKVGSQNAAAATPAPALSTDTLIGTVTIRNANWKVEYLANHVVISAATLHLSDGSQRWDPVAFSYGPIKGQASLTLPVNCPPVPNPLLPPNQPALQPCAPQFKIEFADLDADALETALLGAREQGTLLSDLINRFHPSTAPPWPELQGTVTADSLALGPVTLESVSADVHIQPTGADITSLDATLLGGSIHATGSLAKPATDQDKPAYTFEGDFQMLDVTDVGALLGLRFAGGSLNGNGKIALTGYTAEDLAASAKGTLHLEWRHGAVGNQPSDLSKAVEVPAALAHFDSFISDAAIADGAITLTQTQVVSQARRRTAQATITLGDPPKVTFSAPKETRAAKR